VFAHLVKAKSLPHGDANLSLASQGALLAFGGGNHLL
jgi:hypothetical protein